MTARIVADMPEAEYHAHPALGSTDLRTLLDAPRKYAYQREHPEPETDSLRLGSAVHALVLGGPHVEVIDGDIKDCDEFAIRKAGGIPVTEAEADLVIGMTRAVDRDPFSAARLAAATDREHSLFAEIDGVPCKGRLDLLALDGTDDLKTSRTSHPAHIEWALDAYGYAIQAGAYRDLLIAVGLGPLPVRLIFVEKSPPHIVTVARLNEASVMWGQEQAAIARRRYLDCMESGVWPGYVHGEVVVGLREHVYHRPGPEEMHA